MWEWLIDHQRRVHQIAGLSVLFTVTFIVSCMTTGRM